MSPPPRPLAPTRRWLLMAAGAATSAGLARRGWAAWDIEYRRIRLSGGWPNTFLDAIITLGHTAGGQLAIAEAERVGLGGTAVRDLVGGGPDRLPRRYVEVDPIRRLPLGVPIRCVHGTSDDTVPISQSEAYVRTTRAAGDGARLLRVPGDHLALIDPTTEAWRRTVAVLSTLTDGRDGEPGSPGVTPPAPGCRSPRTTQPTRSR